MRYAIYYSPAETSLLHQLGSVWLGYNAFTGEKIAQHGDGLLNGKTELAARYGFHATLKAPFYLKPDMKASDLITAAAELSTSLAPVRIEKLVLRLIDGFLALVPEEPSRAVNQLADTCVRELDTFRQEPDEAELIRRHAENLNARQHRYLTEWGYPFVFEEFKFHMTLTKRLDAVEQTAVLAWAESHFADVINRPLIIDSLSVFSQATPNTLFIVEKRFPLTTQKLAVNA